MGMLMIYHDGELIEVPVSAKPSTPSEFVIQIMHDGAGLYCFQVPKENQAAELLRGMKLFRKCCPNVIIASTILSPGYCDDLVQVMIIANPPFQYFPAA